MASVQRRETPDSEQIISGGAADASEAIPRNRRAPTRSPASPARPTAGGRRDFFAAATRPARREFESDWAAWLLMQMPLTVSFHPAIATWRKSANQLYCGRGTFTAACQRVPVSRHCVEYLGLEYRVLPRDPWPAQPVPQPTQAPLELRASRAAQVLEHRSHEFLLGRWLVGRVSLTCKVMWCPILAYAEGVKLDTDATGGNADGITRRRRLASDRDSLPRRTSSSHTDWDPGRAGGDSRGSGIPWRASVSTSHTVQEPPHQPVWSLPSRLLTSPSFRRGKFAAVRRARHRSTNQVFAAKYVKRRRRNVSLEGEARHEVAVLLLGLRDPQIIRLHQVYETRTEYIILLEFAGGGDLQRLLDDAGVLPECEVRAILQQVLRGLAFLHTNAIAHLDIKPQNLVMMGDTPDAGVKLVDFGLSRVIFHGAEITQIMGTPDYVAPEVINFEPISLSTDMWAIGVLTYVFLSGCTPFGGDTDQETFVNITQAEFDFPEDLFADVSEQAKDFICGLLVKKPSDRLTVDDCLNHAWMTAPLTPVHSSILTEPYTEEDTEEPTHFHNGYEDNYTSNDHLYPLAEADHADSAYSSDSSSSPTFTEGYSSLVVPPLCHCTIPEEQQQQQQIQQNQKQIRKQIQIGASATLGRKQGRKGHRLSVDMEDTLRSLHHPHPIRATRRASLVIDDPRYLHEATQHLHEIVRPLAETTRPLPEEGIVTRDSDVDSGVSCHDCEDSRVENPRLCHSDSYDGGDAASVVSWDDYSDLGGRRPSLTHFDHATLCSVAKPWEKLCTGSVSRAITQLTVKKVSKSSELRGSKADLRGSKADLRGSRTDLHVSKSELRASKCDLRASKSDLRASKSDLRSSKAEMRASKSDLRASKADLRASRQDLRASKSDLRASRSDLRASKSDLRASKSDLRASRSDLRASRSDLRGSRTNLTLSRLDLAHETLDNDCVLEDEAEDVLRGDLTLPRRSNLDRTALAPFMRGNSLHMSFRLPKHRDVRI
ncbi:uncharacterized protein LOC134775869 [Penaeus indicus]|uniref:uncharacterized protein LOC134775869 n=1 Tax=Penaeus indicus TaxID=29960 RepID=UPI00300D7D55